MTKSNFIRASFVGFILVIVPMLAGAAKLKVGDNASCYVKKDGGHDQFWYCGKTDTTKCSTRKLNRQDTVKYLYHGDKFSYDGETYWCCGGTTETSGKFTQAEEWIVRTEQVKEIVPGGTCTWFKKYNVCSDEADEVSSDKPCTEATENCATGYKSFNGKCVAACQDGYAYDEDTYQCVACEVTETQGIRNGTCIKCQLNEVFDTKTLNCKSIQELAQSMTPISAIAHDTCWLCVTPSALSDCLKYVSMGNKLNNNPDLANKCSINSKSE